jgi:NADPH-dependent 2,4-dienoyl-CoA reductase/sulfur reductase-like enzyme
LALLSAVFTAGCSDLLGGVERFEIELKNGDDVDHEVTIVGDGPDGDEVYTETVSLTPDETARLDPEIDERPVTFGLTLDGQSEASVDHTYAPGDCSEYTMVVSVGNAGNLMVGKNDPCKQ